MFCTSCGKQLSGDGAFCPHCGASSQPRQPVAVPAAGTTRYAPAAGTTGYTLMNPKPGLRGFPKGWTIFLIVYISTFACTMLPNLVKAPGMILPLLLFLAGMIAGLAFMLKGRAYGFWILLASSVLITLMNGMQSGQYTIFTSGGLVLVIATFFIVRKQLGLFVKKNLSAGNPQTYSAVGSTPMTSYTDNESANPQAYKTAGSMPSASNINHENANANHANGTTYKVSDSASGAVNNGSDHAIGNASYASVSTYHVNTHSSLSLDSFNSPVFEWSSGDYAGANQEWVGKIKRESSAAIAWFNSQNFVPIPSLGDPQLEADYCYSMAEQAQNAGIIQEAWAGFYQALQRYCRLNDSMKIGSTCFNLGKVYGVLKNWEMAMLMFLHGVHITKKLGDQKGFAWSLFYLGDVMSNLGDKATAKLFFAEALPVFRQVLPENAAGVEAAIRRLA